MPNAKTQIDFLGKGRLAVTLSLVFIVISIGSLFVNGLNLGIDFTGGTSIEVRFAEPADLGEVRAALNENGFDKAVVQNVDTARDVLIRIAPRPDEDSAELSNAVLELMRSVSHADVEMRSVDFVGPQVGEELRDRGGIAILVALAGILLYVWVRFIHWGFSVGSVLALVHDVIITVGVFSITGISFDLTVLAAILAVIGYSLNDTIVVFDRVRENFRLMRKAEPRDVINNSINQMLTRTLITSGTTVLVLVALLIFGGDNIFGFALALVIGIVVGTYSSIYVASYALILLGVTKQDLMPVEKEGEGEETP
ncbi:MAG: protein translocase subunit SecF [Gammaproteobacteria bacterium]|nr:protein translocase subunit SecF [Gammaproteobacteria bacterium]MDX5374831.1 protein translocase subunit SecF [Gammaproteobacteria bacterium]